MRDYPWLTFTQTPITILLGTHSIPIDILPYDDEQLFPSIQTSIHNTKPLTIGAAWYLNQAPADRLAKQATLLVVSVNPDHVPILLPVPFLFSKRLKIKKTMQANQYTQGTNCSLFGHTSSRFTQKNPSCPYCTLPHPRSPHRCQNPTSTKGGDSKAVSSCCPSFPPPNAQTLVTTTMASPENAGLNQSRLLMPRPQHILTKNYPTHPLTVRKP